MNFLDLAKKRYSVREYHKIPVEQEIIDQILEAGRVAPTAANQQPNKFLVLNDEISMEKLSKGTNPHGAPLAIVVCADKDIAWVRRYDQFSAFIMDATIATDHMMLQAEDLGLGSCWIASFDPEIIRQEFNIPRNLIPVNILVVGYPAGTPALSTRHSTTRKPIDPMVSYRSF